MSYDYAPWLTRVLGYLVDSLVILVPYIVALILALIVGTVSDTLGVLVGIVGWLASIAVAVWNLGYKQGTTGQSIGKGVVGIRLLREADGQVVGFGMAVARYFVHILDSLPCYIGWLWPLWDPKRQTFADKILQTVVVK